MINSLSRMPSALIAVACVSVLCGTATAQQPASRPGITPTPVQGIPQGGRCDSVIGGTVTRRVGDMLNGPSRPAGVRGIQVQLLNADGDRMAQVRTDRDGRFGFRNLCAGNYTVCPGTPCPAGGAVPSRYAPAAQDVRVPPILRENRLRAARATAAEQPRE